MALRLVFMGTPDFAVPTLVEIVGGGHEVVAVYTRAPQPAGRGMALSAEPGRARGRAVRTADLHAEDAEESADAADAMRAHGADAAVVVAYGLILPKPILEAFPLGCFNLHASLLPRWRGAAPIHRAIMAGDRETGVMVMKMDEGLDTGPIAMAERVPIGRRYDDRRSARRAGAARRRSDAGRARRARTRLAAADAAGGTTASPTPTRSTRTRRASTGRKPWQEVHDHCRGLSPFPGAWFELAGAGRVKVSAHDERRRQRRSPAACSTTS